MDQKDKNENKNRRKIEDDKPWYKFPMVWFVIALPTIAVIASIATLVIATKNAPQVLEHNISYKTKLENTKD